jgi:hypothetical protein
MGDTCEESAKCRQVFGFPEFVPKLRLLPRFFAE